MARCKHGFEPTAVKCPLGCHGSTAGIDDADEETTRAALVNRARAITNEQIIAAIRLVSYVVIVIIMAVMANTMAMSARERTAEYAMLKTLGFRPSFIAAMVFGESAAICALGGGLGIAAMPQVAADAEKKS